MLARPTRSLDSLDRGEGWAEAWGEGCGPERPRLWCAAPPPTHVMIGGDQSA